MQDQRSGSGRMVAVGSGKGGVGKTTLAVNLALGLAEEGARVLLVDADFALGSVDVLLGLSPAVDSGAALAGRLPLRETLSLGPRGVTVAPAPSGRADLAALTPAALGRFLGSLDVLARRYDWTVVDLPSGIGPHVLPLASRADVTLLVTVPEPAALLGAYAVTKLLVARGRAPRLVMNRMGVREQSPDLASRLLDTASRHLGSAPEIWGSLPEDPAVLRAALDREPFILAAPRAPISVGVRELARRLAVPQDGGARLRVAGAGTESLHPVPAA